MNFHIKFKSGVDDKIYVGIYDDDEKWQKWLSSTIIDKLIDEEGKCIKCNINDYIIKDKKYVCSFCGENMSVKLKHKKDLSFLPEKELLKTVIKRIAREEFLSHFEISYADFYKYVADNLNINVYTRKKYYFEKNKKNKALIDMFEENELIMVLNLAVEWAKSFDIDVSDIINKDQEIFKKENV